MPFVETSQAGFGFFQSRFQNAIYNAPLLVTKQRFQGIDGAAEMSIQSANHSGYVSTGECPGQFLDSPGVAFVSLEAADAGAERVISHVQHRKRELLAFLRDARTNVGLSHNQLCVSSCLCAVIARVDAVAVFGGPGFKEGTDRVVSADLLQSHHRRLHPLAVDVSTISVLGQIALRMLQAIEKS